MREIEGRETREERDRRRIESSYGLEGYEAPEAIWFNKQKELEGQRAGERGLVEAPVESIAEDETVVEEAFETGSSGQAQTANGTGAFETGNGIFGSSTLAALKGYSPSASSAPNAKPAPAAGPLVAYGSDDDDD